MHFWKRVGFLIAVGIGLGALQGEPRNAKWEQEISAIEQREAETPPPANGIVFTGSSSIRLWKTLAEDFPHHPVVNRGFGGSQISDLIGYFDRVVVPTHPRQVVVYSGTNDISGGESAEQVLADWATLCGMIEVALPGTKIALIAAAPNPARWSQRAEQSRFNALAAAYCARNGYDFIDVWTPMLGADGTPSRDIYVDDKLHMNAAGYVMWRAIVAPYLID
ncbi:SGNH/GDSL hydrolase family protein [Synoicihabitans lomoniglobus]|uniref:SGNH/GDSL hydrolase family protein n=1 Tax=Synoicihabitans lomoniglobus TaxID=2909285 RepID=A0AAF0CPJ0_9BACT|nr:GDSL-type esterase/lipase family protein [Opitutaceae bacterium LMO-M01]WED64999.1 SGNH/GDSL hydrolase family protein [Opitutaceae bacterium LMO-M01]